MNDILTIARLRIALQRAFLGRASLRVIMLTLVIMMTMATMMTMTTTLTISTMMTTIFLRKLEVVQCTHCRVDRSEWWIISQLLNTDQCRYRAARAASYESTKVQKVKNTKKVWVLQQPRGWAGLCQLLPARTSKFRIVDSSCQKPNIPQRLKCQLIFNLKTTDLNCRGPKTLHCSTKYETKETWCVPWRILVRVLNCTHL